MVRTFKQLVVVALATMALASLSQSARAASTMMWGGEVNGAFNTHSMSDWSDVIDQANSSGSNFDKITSGMSFGVGPYVVVNDKWKFGANYEMLIPKKSSDQGTDIKLNANSFGVTGGYLFPSKSSLSYGVGVGVDFVSLGASKITSTGGPDITQDGSGVGFKVMGSGGYAFAPEFSGVLTVGYRVANIKVKNYKGGGVTVDPASAGLPDHNDYSGVMIRVGIDLHMAKK